MWSLLLWTDVHASSHIHMYISILGDTLRWYFKDCDKDLQSRHFSFCFPTVLCLVSFNTEKVQIFLHRIPLYHCNRNWLTNSNKIQDGQTLRNWCSYLTCLTLNFTQAQGLQFKVLILHSALELRETKQNEWNLSRNTSLLVLSYFCNNWLQNLLQNLPGYVGKTK